MAISISALNSSLAMTNASIGIDPSSGGINVSGSPGTISSGDSVIQSLEKLDTAIETLNTVDAGLSMNKANLSGANFYGPIGVQQSFISTTKWTFSVNASEQLVFNYNGTDVASLNTDGTSSFGGGGTIAAPSVYQNVDGATTAFTIEAGRTENDVLVFYNGVCLVPTVDYTISGTTLTTTFTPAATSDVVIRYMAI
jgi:hypothetical protein